MDWGLISNIIASLAILTLLEIVLGVDNLVFIAIITAKLPANQQPKARRIGLTLAWVMRLVLLALAFWIIQFTYPLFSFWEFDVSGKDIFLFTGGLFLLAKATEEIHNEFDDKSTETHHKRHTMLAVITQIGLLDLVFSLDSIMTAVGLTHLYWVMAVAITIAIIVMIAASEPLTRFINAHPPIKMLALSFLILIGTMLIADGLHFHIPRGYVYFALGFSMMVELLNLLHKKKQNVQKSEG